VYLYPILSWPLRVAPVWRVKWIYSGCQLYATGANCHSFHLSNALSVVVSSSSLSANNFLFVNCFQWRNCWMPFIELRFRQLIASVVVVVFVVQQPPHNLASSPPSFLIPNPPFLGVCKPSQHSGNRKLHQTLRPMSCASAGSCLIWPLKLTAWSIGRAELS